jgi:hypothetical protein
MAACSAGSLLAGRIMGSTTPDFMRGLGLQRYADARLMAGLASQQSKGVL